MLAVFVAGLMVGRTPEYLGKKIEAREIKLALLALLVFPASLLGFAAVAAVLPPALEGLLNKEAAHGLSEILYAFTRRPAITAQPSRAFPRTRLVLRHGPRDRRCCWRVSGSGRCGLRTGGLARGEAQDSSGRLGTLPTHTWAIHFLSLGVVVILGGLNSSRRWRLDAIVEHFLTLSALANLRILNASAHESLRCDFAATSHFLLSHPLPSHPSAMSFSGESFARR